MELSIITINYNNAEGLRKTLASVASQTYRNIEHVIVDGGSTDGSVDVIREYEEQLHLTHSTIHIQWLSEKDNGIYNAMNKGIEIAIGRRGVNADHTSYIIHHTSEAHPSSPNSLNSNSLNESPCDYIWILNSGDCAAGQDVVERMMSILEFSNSKDSNFLNGKIGVPILLGNIVKVYSERKKVSEKKMPNANVPKPLNVSMLTFYTGTVPQDAAFVRRDLFEKYGLFDEALKICGDWKLYINIIALSDVTPMYVDVDVVLFDMSGISNANDELRLAERRAYLENVLPSSVLKDYDAYAFPIEEYNRLKKYHLWWLVYFVERVLFKLEKWHILSK